MATYSIVEVITRYGDDHDANLIIALTREVSDLEKQYGRAVCTSVIQHMDLQGSGEKLRVLVQFEGLTLPTLPSE